MLPSYREIAANLFGSIWYHNDDFTGLVPRMADTLAAMKVDPETTDIRVAFGQLELKLMVDRDSPPTASPDCVSDLYESEFRDWSAVFMAVGLTDDPLLANAAYPFLVRFANEEKARLDAKIDRMTLGDLFVHVEELLHDAL